jgi:hypothetical protein
VADPKGPVKVTVAPKVDPLVAQIAAALAGGFAMRNGATLTTSTVGEIVRSAERLANELRALATA